MIFVLILLALIAFWFISTMNTLRASREMVDNAMAQIAVQTESRWDVLKSLIEATKKYSEHEADVLKSITESRAKVGKDATVEDIEKSDQQFAKAMKEINIVAENYPNLKASEIYDNTMIAIQHYEDRVNKSRMIYNDTTTKYNRQIIKFPNSIVAGIINLEKLDYFKASEDKQDMPSWE